MIRNLAALISVAVVFSGSFALSTQSAEAKTSPTNSRRDRNYLVPPPPPYTPSMISSALGMPNAYSVAADAYNVVVEKGANPYGKYNFTRNQGVTSQVARPNPYVSAYPVVEKRMLKQIDDFDSEISSHEKEISDLLNL